MPTGSEQSVLEQMTKVDALKKELGQFIAQKDEREKMRVIAASDRDRYLCRGNQGPG